ncbi:small multi-drug export protein [Metabacillus elymi]|uniref:Small multi-drug export protein n=1 Tax=Metabacillus elymi TaxID=2745198 RepID=A0ABX6S8H4_9BACI|nr:small multi-drug export protein [Metabacillus sp. KUDC1714]QNF30404.1 small multi-drug export protein [Metabacillus sp. KUDC1714]
MFISYFLVFLLAAIPLFELVTVVPLAIIGGLSPVPVAILGFLGNLVTILLLVVFVDKVKGWMKARKQKRVGLREVEGGEAQGIDEALSEKDSKKQKRARSLFDKYGLPGLTIFGPLLVGSHISAFMAMCFGSKRSLVTGWMITSLVIWTVVSTIAASSGVTFFAPDVEQNGFLVRIFQ